MTFPLFDTGAVQRDRAGDVIRSAADNQDHGEPRATRSSDDVTAEVGRRLTLRADPPAVHLTTSPLVGRENELAALRRALRASEVSGHSIVIGGDAGSGKTALLAAFLADVRGEGMTVVEGACVEIESRRPFGAFADVIASCERVFGADRVARSLSERGVSVRQLTSPGPSIAGARAGDRYQMHGATLGLFADLTSDGPLAIVLEDLHWADDASLELFGYLTRRLRGRPVLIVATYRTDELDRRHPLRPALAELRKAHLIEEIPLPPLDIEGTGALIAARLGHRNAAVHDAREFRDLVHARCEGNPLHTEETLDTLRQSGRLTYADGAWTCGIERIGDAIPANVAEGVVARWAALSGPTQQILLTASVIGHLFDLDLLADISATPTGALAPLIHEAIDARLVLEQTKDRRLAFRHALTREALRQQLLHSERVALHTKIAAALRRRQESVPVPAAELAYHLEESGDRTNASRYHEAAADAAAATTDYRGAARSMERAIATASDTDSEQGRRQLALVRYLHLSGDDPRAARAAAAALEIGERVGDARLQGLALIELHNGDALNSDPARTTDLLKRAIALLEPLGPSQELTRAYSSMAGTSSRLRDGDAGVAFAERARAMATALDLPAELAWATLQVATGQVTRGQLAESIATNRAAITIAERAGLIDELYAALMTLRVQLVATGATSAEQRDLLLRMRAVAKTHGLGSQSWIVRELSSLHGEADWDGFLTLFSQLPEPDRSDADGPRLMALFTAVARTGPDGMGELDGARLRAKHIDSAPSATWSAESLLLAGRAAEAVALAASVDEEEVARRFWGLIPASLVHSVGLFAARECGDDSARQRFVESLLIARPLPVTPNYNRRHIALANGDIAEREGRIDDALAAYGVALAECERAQYNDDSVMYLISLIWQRRAELYLQLDPPDFASAQAEFDALLPHWQKAKATWYLGELRTWADAHSLAFPKTAEVSPAAPVATRQLTRRELEVARFVAQGLTNREIGARLSLSVRTAEGHVAQIREKLGFRTRAQIASWVTERYGAVRPS